MTKTINRAQAEHEVMLENEKLRELLREAAEDVEAWGAYASGYFQEKHDLAGCAAKYRAAGVGDQEDGGAELAAIAAVPMRAALSHQAEPVEQAEFEWPKLEKPAQVGAWTFCAGVSTKQVVEAAQRLYQYEQDPPFSHEQIESLRESFGTEPVEPAPAQDEREECRCTSERRLVGEGCQVCNLDDDIHQLAFEVGDPAEDASGYWFDMESFNEFAQKLLPVIREPYEDVLRSLACSLGSGGYNAPAVDPAVFEQKIRWGIDQLTRQAQTELERENSDLRAQCGGMQMEIDELRTAQTAQTAHQPIRLPARAKPTPDATVSNHGFCDGWNNCLDAVTRLSAAPIAQTAPQPAPEGQEWVLLPIARGSETEVKADNLKQALTLLDFGLAFALCNTDHGGTRRDVKKAQQHLEEVKAFLAADPQPEQRGLADALQLAASRLDRLGLNQPPHTKEYHEAREWAEEAFIALRDYRAALSAQGGAE